MAAQSTSEPTSGSLASEQALRPFLAPTFDPADYLNATLPSWTPTSTSRGGPVSSSNQLSSLTDLNAQTQSLVSQLSAQLTRLSGQLTKLTDDILRSGGRLAYEVEILRGDTVGLNDVLVDGLADDLKRFLPGGLKPSHARRRSSTARTSVSTNAGEHGDGAPTTPTAEQQRGEPKTSADAITRLRTLALVRDRLESVIKVFGAAIDWPIPPSDVNLRNTFISVAGPEAENTEEREKKGKAWAEKTKSEVEAVQRGEGYEAAMGRVEELEQLAEVWKGTSEEKARLKFVETLRKAVDERKAQASGKLSAPGRGHGLG